MQATEIKQCLDQGIAAAKTGRRQEAREWLMKVVEADEGIESAWLWLSGVVDSDQDRLICLENVLTLNPDNAQARAGLDWLQAQGVAAESYAAEQAPTDEALFVEESSAPDKQPLADPVHAAQPPPEDTAASFLGADGCAYCGRAVAERAKRCPHCGQSLFHSEFTRAKVSANTVLCAAMCMPLGLLNIVEWYLIDLIWRTDVPGLSDFLQRWVKRLAGPTVYDPGSFRGGLGLTAGDIVQMVRVIHLILAALFFLGMFGLILRLAKGHTLALVTAILQIAITLGGLALGIWATPITFMRVTITVLLTIFLFQSLQDFDKKHHYLALEIDRHLVNAMDYYNRGREYQQQGMWAKALIHWRRAAALSPLYDTCHVAVARAYYNLACYDQALQAINQAIQVSREPAELEPLRQRILEASQNLS